MARYAVVDQNNLLRNTIIATSTDTAPDGCRLIEIPDGYFWDGTKVSLMPEPEDAHA